MENGNGPIKILVTGGGTGGHTTPAVAAIQAIRAIAQKNRLAVAFWYLGSTNGVERASARDIGVDFIGIATGKLRRADSALRMLNRRNIADMFRVPLGFAQALSAMRRIRPDVVLSTGGYVSVPGVVAAALLRIPVVAHEQTAQIGLANKINFRFAQTIALSVEETLNGLPEGLGSAARVTGNPVREIVFGGDADRARRRYGFDGQSVSLPGLYITGGAQGSHVINRAVMQCLPDLLARAYVVHQCGVQRKADSQDYDLLRSAAAGVDPALQARYAAVKHVGDEIGDVYALSDIVVGRSGAGTVAEICALGKPAVFVPLVPTGGDEQTRNAQRLVEAGAATIVRQADCNAVTLMAALVPLLNDPQRRREMGEKARTLAHPDAAEKLAGLVLAAAGCDLA